MQEMSVLFVVKWNSLFYTVIILISDNIYNINTSCIKLQQKLSLGSLMVAQDSLSNSLDVHI